MASEHQYIQLKPEPLTASNVEPDVFLHAESGQCCEAGDPPCDTLFGKDVKVRLRQAKNGDLLLQIDRP